MKDPFILFLGDTHTLSDSGLCIPGFQIMSKKRPYQASHDQEWLHEKFLEMQSTVKEMAKGYSFGLFLGADLNDGVIHHETTETTGIDDDQIAMSVQLIKPLSDVAEFKRGLTGTESHTGHQGDTDRTICRELGIPVDDFWNIVICGKRLWWSHHGISVSRREAIADNGLISLARDVDDYCRNTGEPKPDLIVTHHVHKSPHPINIRGITVATVGCWQLSTYHGKRISPFKPTDIGVLWWKPHTMEVGRLLYARHKDEQRIEIGDSTERVTVDQGRSEATWLSAFHDSQ